MEEIDMIDRITIYAENLTLLYDDYLDMYMTS